MATLADIFENKSSSSAIIIPSTSTPTKKSLVLTYPQLLTAIRSFQRQLTGQLPPKLLEPGDVVSLVYPNSLEFAIAFLGTTLLRLVSAPLNPNYKEDEFKFYIEDAKSKVLILPRGYVAKNEAAVKAARAHQLTIAEIAWDYSKNDIVVEVLEGPKDDNPGVTDETIQAQEQDIALLLHTSGTTGRPKGVPLTHLNLHTTMKNITATYILTPKDRSLVVMPLFHVHGLMCGLLSTLLSGGTAVIPLRFSASTFWAEYAEGGCNWYTAVPTIHQILLRHPAPQPLPSIRFIRSCSSSLAPSTFHALEATFKAPVLEAYAMTEAAHQMTSNPLPEHGPRKPGSVGRGQGVQLAILDEEGNPVEEGEVCIKGPNVTKGYLNNPEANTKNWTRQGWFRTGDQGKLDREGYLFLTGRIKELINRGGEKFTPLEIDAVLLECPLVAEGVSFAVPDEMYGQDVHAVVVLKGSAGKDRNKAAEDIKAFCATKLAKFKIPKVIYVVDEVPKTATGKVQRANLAKILFKGNEKPKAKL